jgi:hypothetical protein
MPRGGANSERVLILAPHGRDAEVASGLLNEAGLHTTICIDVSQLSLELEKGAAFAVLTDRQQSFRSLHLGQGPAAMVRYADRAADRPWR